MTFAIITLDGDHELVEDANAYQLEGPFTTFFQSDGGHGKISGWSLRVASLRTDRIASIRRVDPGAPPAVTLHETLEPVGLRAV